MSSKQKTLFQSWGGNASTYRGKGEQPVRGRGGGQDVAPVIDLCEEEEEEDILLAHALDISCAEEPTPHSSTSNSGSFSTLVRKNPTNLFSKYGAHDQNEAHTEDGNVSVGADIIQESLLPTSIAHDAASGTESSDLPDFDKQAGRLWIYPTNYPVRDYQYNIVQQCLYKNTMVTLPTGLGKTFIAAVVMYNFYQWYPQGKIVFMAPTKPLVAQQIDACYNIMGIPHADTAEMTGTMNPTERQCVWKERRVFFLTPQVMTNDLSRGTCPAADVRCLVIDEAHRALGNHAYCQVVRELVKYTKQFRVLALSATPGTDIKAVQHVISNLLISQIELRTEECLDIKPYTHERKVDKIVVPLGQELSALRDQYTQVMSMVVQRLIRHRAIYKRDPASLSKFLILKAREAFRQDPPQQLSRQQYGAVEGDFALALSLYHGYELLQLHGLRSLYNFLQTVLSGEKGHGRTRTELLKSSVFLQVMDTLRHKFDYDESSLSCTQKKSSYVSAHPKMKKLEEVVLEHFDKVSSGGEAETRVMIFSQYRDSVQEITQLLNMHQPRVKAMSFIGQSSVGKSTKGFTQKEQLKVMKEFREGGYNTLISTCVGEEGLDIGDIDLIICFDAHKSPIRLVQRMGRTGRKRQGRIVMLVTQGKEEQIYNQSQYSKRSIHKAIMNGARSLHFYQDNPRMLPEGVSPVCHKMFITVSHTQIKTTKTVKAQKKITSFEKAKNQGWRREVSDEDTLTRDEWLELQEHLVPTHELRFLPAMPPSLLCLDTSQPGHSSLGKRSLSLNEWMPWQNRLQTTRLVDHSTRSKHLVELMEFIELQELLEANNNQYSLEMENFLNHDDVLESGQQEEVELETVSLSDQCKRVDVRGEARWGGDRRKGRWEMLPALSGGEEDVEEELPVFDVGGRAPGRPHHKGHAQLLLLDQTDPHLTKQKKKKNIRVKNESTFLESFSVDDLSDFEEDKTLIMPQVFDKTKCLVERQCSRTTLPKDIAVSLAQPYIRKKHDLSHHNECKMFVIPSPPPLNEIKDVFCELTEEYPSVDVASVVSEWYKETFGESVQVRWAEEAEAIVPVSESGTTSRPDNSVDSDAFPSNNDNQMYLESDVFHESKHVNLLNECDDEKFKTVPVGLMTTDQESKATCTDTSRTHVSFDSIQNEDASPKFNENQSSNSLSHQSLQENNSACEVTAMKDCLTFTQAMACVQSSEEHSQALPQPSSLSPEPLTAQKKTNLFPDISSRDKGTKLSPGKPEIENNSDISPSHFTTDRSRELSLDHFLSQRNNHLSENHLVTNRSKDLSQKHLTAESSRECSPNSDILFCEMPSFNLFDDVSDVDISKEGDNIHKLPSQLPCQAASLSANTDQDFHEEGEYKVAMCESSQVNLIEDEFDMPHFELNFDLDEDIIPPSPHVSQPFTQKSFNRSQSAPSSKRKLDLYKTQLERVISDNEVAETLAEDSKLCDTSDAALPLQQCPSIAKDPLITKEDATPKTKHLLSSFPGQVRSSTPKQSLNTFTQLRDVCHHPPSPQDEVFVAGEKEEQDEVERKKGEQSENLSALSLTWIDISPSSHHTRQGLKGKELDVDLDDDSFVEVKKRKAARILEDSKDFLLRLRGPSFKTPSRPTVRHRKRFKMDQGSSKSVSTSSAASSDGMSTSWLPQQDEADDFVSGHSAGDTRLHKHHTGTASSRRRPKRLACEFLDHEAVLSGDSAASSDELLNSQEDDQYELSFVNDHTQMTEVDVDMQAVYLRSVRSPEEVPNRFRLQPRHYHRHVFSPGVKGAAEEGRGAGDIDGSGDEYEEDSFCVAEGHEDTEYFEEDFLDELENILCKGKQKFKVAKTKTSKLGIRTNRKRIRHFSGSSSEEEFKLPVPVSISDDTQDRTANREDVLDLLCTQRPDPGPRRRKLIVCSSDEETSPQTKLQCPSRDEATPHILTLSPTAANLGSRHTTVTCLSGGRRQRLDQGSSLEQEELVRDMNKNKTVDNPALVEKSWDRGGRVGSCIGYQLNSTEKSPVLNNFNQELQDFDFVSDQLKNSITKPLAVSSKCRQKERVVVLVDSRELSGAQNIISCLRLKHGFTVAARQLEACDYILSCRLAVDRRGLSDFSNGANRTRLMERLQRMREIYDRCCLIVERDRLKSGDVADRNSPRSKYCDWIQALLVHTNIRLFYTDNQDETSALLVQLAEMEKRKGMNICLSPDVSTEKEQCIKFYSSMPMLNYANALYLANSFSNIKDFISRCSPGCLSAAGQMTEVRAAHIITYIKHTFDLQMLPTRL